MGRLGLLMLCAGLLASSAMAAAPGRAPRTAWGAPDLDGVWTNASQTYLQRRDGFKALVATPAEAAAFEQGRRTVSAARAAAVAPDAPALPPDERLGGDSEWREWGDQLARLGGQPRTSWITDPADGRLPYTAAGRAAAARIEAAGDTDFTSAAARPTDERCLAGVGAPAGPPMLNASYNANYQFVQTPDTMAILAEMNHDVRIIRLDPARRHAAGGLRPWLGDSVGWWEGDTLVVETVAIHPLQSGQFNLGGRIVLSDAAKVVERFTRTRPAKGAPGELNYRFTVSDPVNYRQAWSAEMPLRATKGPIFEYACHEGNYALANVLSGARAAERAAAGK
jgi:hypothetical protein